VGSLRLEVITHIFWEAGEQYWGMGHRGGYGPEGSVCEQRGVSETVILSSASKERLTTMSQRDRVNKGGESVFAKLDKKSWCEWEDPSTGSKEIEREVITPGRSKGGTDHLEA